MSAREWAPGDVAMLQLLDLEVPALRTDNSGWVTDRGAHYHPALHARPLAVIDPEDSDQVARLAALLRAHGWTTNDSGFSNTPEALREFANPTPPKPEEPTGLGAVVRTVDGDLYLRDKTTTTVAHWKRARGEDSGRRYRYADLPVVETLSEGVPHA